MATPDPSGEPAPVDAELVAEIVGSAPDPDEVERIEDEERHASQRLATTSRPGDARADSPARRWPG